MSLRLFVAVYFLGMFAMPTDAEATFVCSPEIHADGRVTLRYFAPAAKQVNVSSNVTAINQPMSRDEQGVWTVTVGPLPADTYSYSFDVDGAHVIDPVNRNTKPWLWMESMIEVPGEKPAAHQLQSVPHGQVHLHWYDSPRLKQTRRLLVYTPPGYGDSGTTYPVLYLLHGCGDDESAWTKVGQVQHLADNLLAAGQAKPMVIVMPFGHDVLPDNPDFEDYDCLRNLAAVEPEFWDGVLPYVESKYRVSTEPEQRAIAGLSMGGGQALRLGLTHPDQFQWVAGFSSAIKKHRLTAVLPEKIPSLQANGPWLWLGCGKEDFLYEDNVAFDQWLDEHALKHTTYFDDGNHNWRTWRGYLAKILPKLFQE